MAAVDEFALLPAIEIETAPDADAAVIFLHGLGDDGHGWSDMVPALAIPTALRVRFVFPHAPEMPVTINGGYVMPAWYDLLDADFKRRADLDGVNRSRKRVENLLARERERGIVSSRIVLGGFSQGGAIALHAGLRHGHKLAGIVALSTYLIDAETLIEQSSANRRTPIFMAHGTQDEVVRFEWGDASRAKLAEEGWPVEWHSYRIPHSAVLEEIQAIGRFIARALTPA
ncbi:MAG TPA: alpha/beta fold hydrolase [Casimicrobiaceae bacterium]|nr:alpha/beta fold hydrolase [Casimicrobiaceae bacterium]